MIACDQLTKRFGTQLAVDGATFTCEPGTVTGFLGPNGAGKSTTMRMICGLTPPTSGHSTVGGRSYKQIPNPAREIGVLLDASAQHPGRTGRETLGLIAMTIGEPKSRVAEMLELVGLDRPAAKKRVSNYSLGMRQRLGIAGALIGDPKILILDEPVNGLDPEGIHWMRTILRDFASAGGTVLLSSHLLSEIEQIADRLVVINRGRIVANGTAEELLSQSATGTAMSVTATDPHALAAAFEAAGIWWQYAADGTTFQAQAEPAAIGAAALRGQVMLTLLEPVARAGLEGVFLDLIRNEEGA